MDSKRNNRLSVQNLVTRAQKLGFGQTLIEEKILKDVSETELNWKLRLSICDNVLSSQSGVILTAEIPKIGFWSVSIQEFLGYREHEIQGIKFWWDVFEYEQSREYFLNLEREMKSRKELLKTENGRKQLMESRIQNDTGRALVVDKNGALIEVVIKRVKVYKVDHPAEIQVLIGYLYW